MRAGEEGDRRDSQTRSRRWYFPAVACSFLTELNHVRP